MKASEIFQKTVKGQLEVESRSNALSMKERRVLILVNGENEAAKLKQLSLCDNIIEILQVLLEGGFIVPNSENTAQTAAAAGTDTTEFEIDKTETETAFDIGAREFMCNTLLTFANRVRVAKLIEEISDVENIDALKNMVKPWYHAIAETPGGMYQADSLRNEVKKLIADEEVAGLR